MIRILAGIFIVLICVVSINNTYAFQGKFGTESVNYDSLVILEGGNYESGVNYSDIIQLCSK